MEQQLNQAAQTIKQADVLFISSGAGMGVDSGLPDFRGTEGFWMAYPHLKEEGIEFEELANPQWFFNDHYRAWGFYGQRFNLYKHTEPHEGFQILKKWAATKSEYPFVFTSNVDGHFQKAGFNTQAIYECHGSINFLQCADSCTDMVWAVDKLDLSIDSHDLIATGNFPKCLYCGRIARPNIVMFGDWSWVSLRADEQNRRFNRWQLNNKSARIVTIELGAGTNIPTVRYESDTMSGKTIRINPREAQGNPNTISIPMGALEALQLIDQLL